MIRPIVSISLLSILCTACAGNDIKSYLQKPTPDEFSVITNQPLIVPPNFELKAPNNNEPETEQSYHYSDSQASKLDKNDKEFLSTLGSKHKKTNVKKTIDTEHSKTQKEIQEKGVIRKAISNLNNERKDTIIDPEKESERLKSNFDEGKSINEGEVPEKEQKSTLEKIFN